MHDIDLLSLKLARGDKFAKNRNNSYDIAKLKHLYIAFQRQNEGTILQFALYEIEDLYKFLISKCFCRRLRSCSVHLEYASIYTE